MSLSLLASQIIAAVILFISTLVCGVLPTWIGKQLLAKSPCKENIPKSMTVVDENNVHVNVVQSHQNQHLHQQHHHQHNHSEQHNHNHNQILHQQHSPESTRGFLNENQSKLASTAFGRKTLSFLMNLGGEHPRVPFAIQKTVMNGELGENHFILDFPCFTCLSLSLSSVLCFRRCFTGNFIPSYAT